MTPRPTLTFSGARGEEWKRVLGTCTVAILAPSQEAKDLVQGAEVVPTECVMLDVAALTEQQQNELINHLARKSGAPRERVAGDVFTRGVPIRLGADTAIAVPPNYTERRRWLNGPDAFDMRFFT